jgi:hypothetical protein
MFFFFCENLTVPLSLSPLVLICLEARGRNSESTEISLVKNQVNGIGCLGCPISLGVFPAKKRI